MKIYSYIYAKKKKKRVGIVFHQMKDVPCFSHFWPSYGESLDFEIQKSGSKK